MRLSVTPVGPADAPAILSWRIDGAPHGLEPVQAAARALIPVLLIATVTFNAALAWINAQVAPVTATGVATCQALLVGAALLVVGLLRPAGSGRWALFLWVATLGFLLLTLARGHLELRYFSDITSIAVFAMLGLAAGGRQTARAILFLQLLLVAVALWELAAPASFGATFNVAGYYVNTRGFDDDAFWAGQELFLSSERPTGRLLLPGLDVHRGSSLFLEPVSLGNWTIVVSLAVAALQPVLRRSEITLLLMGNLILLIACDGRVAMLINLLLVANWFVAPRLPRGAPMLYLPAVFLLLSLARWLGLLAEEGDTLAGRLRYGIDFLHTLDIPTLLGLYGGANVLGADSGWSYFIGTQSLVAMIATWLMLSWPAGRSTPATQRTISGTALFVSLSLPVSYSVFSVKTAAMLWVLHGIAIARDLRTSGRTHRDQEATKGATYTTRPC